MKVRFLGTGTSFGVPQIGCDCEVCTSTDPRDSRFRSSILVQHNGVSVVVDTGPDFRQQCLRCRLERLDAVCLTHFHADHVFGLDDVRVFNYLQKEAIPVYVPETDCDDFQRVFSYATTPAAEGLVRPRFDVQVVTLSPFTIGDLAITPLTVHHGEDNITGYQFAAGGRRLAYLTDCKTLPAPTMDVVRGADVVVLSALWREDWNHPGHMNLDEALVMAEQLGGGQTYFTHATHRIGRHAETNESLPDRMALAYDGLEVDL